MKALQHILVFKITFTLLFLVVPMLLVPPSLLAHFSLDFVRPILLQRLLGIAYLALVAGYLSALHSLKQGQWPQELLWMGLVSNGGAAILIFVSTHTAEWKALHPNAQYFLLFAGGAVGLIALGLLFFGFVKRKD